MHKYMRPSIQQQCFNSQRHFKDFPYVCRKAVCLTMSHWENRFSPPSRTEYVPQRRWSAPCCALWSSPPPCWHGQVCQDPHRCPPSHLQWEITRQAAMKTRAWKRSPLYQSVRVHRWVLLSLYDSEQQHSVPVYQEEGQYREDMDSDCTSLKPFRMEL